MKPLHPRIGSLVAYRLTEADADQVNRRRVAAHGLACDRALGGVGAGVQVHVGNPVAAGDVLPLIVTRTARLVGRELVNLDDQVAANLFKTGIDASAGIEVINGQVQLDGNDTLWVTNRFQHYDNDGLPYAGCWARLTRAEPWPRPTVKALSDAVLAVATVPADATPAHTDGVA